VGRLDFEFYPVQIPKFRFIFGTMRMGSDVPKRMVLLQEEFNIMRVSNPK
jgi:hypothetical protein